MKQNYEKLSLKNSLSTNLNKELATKDFQAEVMYDLAKIHKPSVSNLNLELYFQKLI